MMMMMMIIICIHTHSFLSISGLTAIFQVDLVSRYQNVSSAYIIAAKGDGVTTAAIRLAKLQSNRHHQQTNTQVYSYNPGARTALCSD